MAVPTFWLRGIMPPMFRMWESEQSCISFHQEDAHHLVEMTDPLALILPGVPGQDHTLFLELLPSPKGLHQHMKAIFSLNLAIFLKSLMQSVIFANCT